MKYYAFLLLLFSLSCESPFATKPTDGDIFEVSHDYNGERIYHPTPVTIEWSNITIKKFKEFLVERSSTYGDSTVWEEITHLEDSLQIVYVDTIDDDITYQYRVRIFDQDDQFIHALSEQFTVPNVSSLKVPDHYENPQEAYDSKFMDDGDSVSVFPGLYKGHFQFINKNVTVRSTTFPEITLLAASPGIGSVVQINRGILSGFTVIGGRALYGGGVLAYGTAKITNCIVRNNMALLDANATLQIHPNGMGAGVYLQDEAQITDSKVKRNLSYEEGAGIMTDGNNSIIRCKIYKNNIFSAYPGGGRNFSGIYQHEGTLLIRNSIIRKNSTTRIGGGLGINGIAQIYNCIIDRNSAQNGGAGIVINYTGIAEIVNCVLVRNATGSPIFSGAAMSYGDITILNSVVWNNIGTKDPKLFGKNSDYTVTNEISFSGGTNIKKDPLFIDSASGNYRLGSSSPCKDSGHPNEIYNDVDGSRNDMGVYGGPFGNDW